MSIKQLEQTWNRLAKRDALWAVRTDPPQGKTWNVEEFFATGRHDVQSVIDAVRRANLQPGCGDALDFGCGLGRLSQALAQHFDRVVGVDVSSQMVQQAQNLIRCGERCQFVHNASDSLGQFADASFDLVLSLIVLQHLPPELAERYLREFLRVLRPGGVLAFQLPVHPAANFGGLMLRVLPIGVANLVRRGMFMHGRTPEEVARLVAGAGGAVRASEADDRAGPYWVSRLYIVERRD